MEGGKAAKAPKTEGRRGGKGSRGGGRGKSKKLTTADGGVKKGTEDCVPTSEKLVCSPSALQMSALFDCSKIPLQIACLKRGKSTKVHH